MLMKLIQEKSEELDKLILQYYKNKTPELKQQIAEKSQELNKIISD